MHEGKEDVILFSEASWPALELPSPMASGNRGHSIDLWFLEV